MSVDDADLTPPPSASDDDAALQASVLREDRAGVFKLPPPPLWRGPSGDSTSQSPSLTPSQTPTTIRLTSMSSMPPPATSASADVFKLPETPLPGTRLRAERRSSSSFVAPTPGSQMKKRKTAAEQEWNSPYNSSKRVKLDKRPSPYVHRATPPDPSAASAADGGDAGGNGGIDLDLTTPRSKRLRRLELDRLLREAGTPRHAPPELAHVSPAILEEDEDDRADFVEFLSDGFTPHEAALFQRIRKRGREWLFPDHWRLDFPTVPENLFAPAEAKEIGAIDSLTLDGSYNAMKAFEDLIDIGTRVRDRVLVGKSPEPQLVSGLEKYIKWSIEDYRTHIKGDGPDISPRIVISQCKGRGPEYGQSRMRAKLRALAHAIRTEDARISSLGHPLDPKSSSTIYGFAVAGSIVAVVTYDAVNTSPDYEERTLAVMDWTDMTLDFWNAVSVALVVIAAREDEYERNRHYTKEGLVKVPLVLDSAVGRAGRMGRVRGELERERDMERGERSVSVASGKSWGWAVESEVDEDA